MKPYLVAGAFSLLVACTKTAPPDYCGVSFCIVDVGAKLSQKRDVEDFIFYRFKSPVGDFTVYEGNFPKMPSTPPRMSPSIAGGKGNYYEGANKAQFVIERKVSEWPAYISVESGCDGKSCAARDIIKHIEMKSVS